MRIQLNANPTELTTGATDALLGILALGCLWYLSHYRQIDRWKVGIWTWVLGLLTAAAILGAVVHGLALSDAMTRFLWRPLFLLLALLVALFVVAAVYDLAGLSGARRALATMIPLAVLFFGMTQLASGTFLVFVVYEALAMLLALGIYVSLAVRRRMRGADLMAVAILLNIVAAGIQATGSIGFALVWQFDHNGVFHLVQSVAVIVLMLGLRTSLLTAAYPDRST
ncbi:MAG: hypothetical protein JSW71_03745 [Gemmatimonadota bacterium]|nr:MAG: hypothetical protein JSW71_03745 [Gemmatimonadota bacterium]